MDGKQARVILGRLDRAAIQQSSVGTSTTNTYLAAEVDAVKDYQQNSNVAIQALQAATVTGDGQHPTAVAVDVDVSNFTITIYFDEVVNLSTWNMTSILMSNSDLSENIELSAVTVAAYGVDDATIVLSLSPYDQDQLQLSTSVGLSGPNSVIQVLSNLVSDFAGNHANPATLTSRDYTPDSVLPSVARFTLDINTSVLSLTLSEVVQAGSVRGERFQLQYQGVLINMTTSETITGSNRSIDILLSSNTTDHVKQALGADSNELLLSLVVFSAAFQDRVGNQARTQQLVADSIVPDTTGPVINYFELNLNTGTAALAFDEPAQLGSANLSKILILDNYWLGNSTGVAATDKRLLIAIDNNTLNQLKEDTSIAINKETSTIQLQAGAVADLNNNANTMQQRPADVYVEDVQGPSLERVSLNLDSGSLALQFSETVDVASLDVTGLTLHEGSTVAASQARISLSSNSNASNLELAATQITVVLSPGDLNALKSAAPFLVQEPIYATLTGATIQDQEGNALAPATREVDTFIPDQTPPACTQFSLNMTSGILSLTFDEVINSSSFNIEQLRLQSSADNSSGASSDTLLGSAQESGPSRVVSVLLTYASLNSLKINTQLAMDTSSTFLSFANGLVSDMTGLPVLAAPATAALATSVMAVDASSPQLLGYLLSMGANGPPILVQLTFSEAVDPTTFVSERLRLQSASNSSTLGTQQLILSSGTLATLAEDQLDIIQFNLSSDDYVGLLQPGAVSIARTASSSYLSASAGMVEDFAGNPALAQPEDIALSLTGANYALDLIQPELRSFALNADEGLITLHFSEAVEQTTLNTSSLLLQNSTAAGMWSISIANSSLLSGSSNSTSLVLQLTAAMQNAIKKAAIIISKETAVIKLDSSFIKDQAQNKVKGVMQAADRFVADSTAPELLHFNLNMTSGRVELAFSEIVDVSTLNSSLAQLASTLIAAGLEQGVNFGDNLQTLTEGDGLNIVLMLATDVSNAIRSDTILARTAASAILRLGAGFVHDMAGNALLLTTRQADIFTLDSSPTELIGFALDLAEDELTLTFQQPIVGSTLNLSRAQLQSADQLTSLLLADVSTSWTPQEVGLVLTLSLHSEGSDNIRRLPLCGNSSDCLLYILDGLAQDVEGLATRVLVERFTATTLIPDGRPPELALRGFTSIDLNTAQLRISFTESVDVSTFDPTKVVLASLFETPDSILNLTGGTILTADDGREVTLQIQPADMIALQSDGNLCLSRSSCYLKLQAGAVLDRAGNALVATGSSDPFTVVQQLVADITKPTLLNYSLDMDHGQLELTFDEAVAPGLRATRITLSNASNSGGTLTLSGGETDSFDTNVIVIHLLDPDVKELKLHGIGLTDTSTFLTLADGVVRDKARNANPSLLTTNAVVAQHQPDVTAPVLTRFAFDFNAGLMTLFFNEPVRLSTFTATAGGIGLITLQSHTNASTGVVVRLPGATLQSATGETTFGVNSIEVILASTDIIAIKKEVQLATASNNTFLSVETGLIQDVSGNNLQAVSNGSALEASTFKQDTSRAELLAFSLDMEASRLTLSFSDAIRGDSLYAAGLTLLGNANATVDERVVLQTSSVTSTDGVVLNISLSAADKLAILVNGAVGTAADSTYLAMRATTLNDLNGRDVIAVTDDAPLLASTYIPDQTAPTITGASLNLTSGELQLIFSEPINATTFNPSHFTIQNRATSPTSQQALEIETTVGQLSEDHLELTLVLDDSNLDSLKLDQTIATSATDTFVSYTTALIKDYAGQSVAARLDSAALGTSFAGDLTSPVAVGFTLDMDIGHLNLTFDEPILSNSLQLTSITLISDAQASVSYSLTGGTNTAPNGRHINIVMLEADINAIKQEQALASESSTTFLQLTAGLISDMANNPSEESVALAVDVFASDQSQPSLVSGIVDMQAQQVRLIFSEAVLASSLDVTGITLEDSTGAVSYQLTNASSGTTNSSDLRQVVVSLGGVDVAALNTRPGLADDLSTSYLSLGPQFIADMANNLVVEVTRVAVIEFVPDQTTPSLSRIVVDLNTSQVELVFNEIVNKSSFQSGTITLTNSTGGDMVVLPDILSAASLGLDQSVLFSLPKEVRNLLVLSEGLLTGALLAQFAAGTVSDVAGNEFQGAVDVMVTYIADAIPPQVVAFTLNMTSEELILTYNEPVRSNSINVTAFQLQGSALAANGLIVVGSITSNNGLVQTVQLSSDVVDTLQADVELAVDASNTYLKIEAGSVADMSGNPLNASQELSVATFVEDTIAPELANFSYQAGQGQIQLRFSEVMNGSSFNPLALLLQGAAASNFISVQLNGTLTPNGAGISFNLTLSPSVLQALQAKKELAVDRNTTFLSTTDVVMLDMSGNPLGAIALDNALQALTFEVDDAQPQLVDVELDMQLGHLYLLFNEVVNASTVNSSQIEIAADQQGTRRLTLTDAVPMTSIGPAVTVQLNQGLLDTLKLDQALATNASNTYVALGAGTVEDAAGQPSAAATFRVVSTYTADTAPPTMTAFSVNMTARLIDLTFSEPVDVTSTQVQSLALSVGARNETVSLAASNITSTANGYTIQIEISSVDFNTIMQDTLLWSNSSTAGLSYSDALVKDMGGNSIASRAATQALLATSYVPDFQSPIATGFSLDLTSDIMMLTFSEPVLGASWDPTTVVLVSSVGDTFASGIQLTSASVASAFLNTTVLIQLGQADLNAMKERTDLATTGQNAFLLLNSGTITDRSGNTNAGIAEGTALPVSVYRNDSVAAILVGVGLDLNESTLTVLFSESMDTQSIVASKLTIQNSADAPSESVTLTGGTAVGPQYAPTFVIKLLQVDVNSIKALFNLASNLSTTFVRVAPGFVDDTNGVSAAATQTAIAAFSYSADVTAPLIVGARLALNESLLVLSLNEPVLASSVNVSRIALQSHASGNAAGFLRLTLSSDRETATLPAPSEIHISLSQHTIVQLLDSANIATSIEDSFVSVANGAVADASHTDISATILQATAYDAYTEAPEVVQFNFTLDGGGTVLLRFSTPVNGSSLDATAITLQSGANATDPATIVFSLTSVIGTELTGNDLDLKLIVSQEDSNSIKSLALCSSAADCFISLTNQLVQDNAGLAVVTIPETEGLVSQFYQPDTTPIELEQVVSFDQNTGRLILRFSEPVDPASLVFSRARLESSAFAGDSGLISLALQAGNTSLERALTLTIALATEDLNTIKLSNNLLCSKASTCFLRIDDAFVTDTSGNPIAGTSSDDLDRFGRRTVDSPTTLTLDTTGPSLLEVALDLNLGILNLTFDEPVNPSSLDLTKALVSSHNETLSPETQSIALSPPNSQSSFSAQATGVRISLSLATVQRLKAANRTGTAISDTFFSASVGMIDDVSSGSNPNQLFSPAQVLTFIQDRVAPSLATVNRADLNTGTFQVTFDEPVLAGSLNGLAITLSSTSNVSEGVAYTLTGAVSAVYAGEVALRLSLDFQLSAADREAINLNTGLAVSRATTFLKLGGSAIQDMALNTNVNMATAVQTQVFVALERSELQRFVLDLQLEQLVLIFSQTMNASSLQASELTLQSTTSGADSQRKLTLSSTTVVASGNGFQLTLNLSQADIDTLQARPGFGTSPTDTFLTVSSDALRDVRGQPVLAVLRTAGKAADSVLADKIQPNLLSFNFSLDTGRLRLSFDEVVSTDSVNASAAALVGSDSNVTYPLDVIGFSLEPTSVLSNGSRVIELQLSKAQVDLLKSVSNVAVNASTTTLNLEVDFVFDMSGNSNNPIGNVVASAFEADISEPELIASQLNLTSGQLLLTFSETVLATASDATLVVLEPTSVLAGNPAQGVVLTTDVVTNFGSTILAILLSHDDLNAVKLLPNLGTSETNTFVRLLAGMTEDTSSLPSLASPGIAVSALELDTVKPSLESAQLDLDQRTVVLKFDEPIKVESIQVTGLGLQSVSGGGASSYSLSASSQVNISGSNLALQATIILSDQDFDSIVLSVGLATSVANTFFTLTGTALTDASDNQVNSIISASALAASQVVVDVTSPQLVSFSVDLHRGLVALRFNEPMNASTLHATRFQAQATLQGPALHKLTGGVLQNSTDGRLLILILDSSDINVIKADSSLWTQLSNTFISFGSDLVKDMNRNPVAASLGHAAESFEQDAGHPHLIAFDFNLDTGELFLAFNESINVSSTFVQAIALQSSFDTFGNPSSSLRLTDGIVSASANSSQSVMVTVTTNDLHALKLASIGTEASRTYLSIDTTLISDMAGLPAVALQDGISSMQVRLYVADTTGVDILSVNLSLDTGVLSMTFSEPVALNSDDVSLLGVQNVSNTSAATRTVQETVTVSGQTVMVDVVERAYSNVTLSSGTVSLSSNGLVASITLSQIDLDAIKLERVLATSAALVAGAGAFQDLLGNPSKLLSNNQALLVSTLEADGTPPQLISFDLDLNSKPATITITFDEPIAVFSSTPSLLFLDQESPRSSDVGFGDAILATSTEGRSLTYNLSAAFTQTVQLQEGLGTQDLSSLLFADPAAVLDIAGNALGSITTGVQPSTFIPDTSSPKLFDATFNLDSGLLSLTFDEIVLGGSNVLPELVDITEPFSGGRVTLSSASQTTGDARARIQSVVVSQSDLNQLKLLPQLAVNASTTTLLLTSGAAKDVYGNLLESASLTVSAFYPDETAPVAISAAYNVETGLLSVSFDEPVRVGLTQGLTLRSDLYTLATSGSVVTISPETVAQLQLSEQDLGSWKQFSGSSTNITIVFSTASFFDSSGNGNLDLTINTSSVQADNQGPSPLSAMLDMNGGSLLIWFDEPVQNEDLSLVLLVDRAANISIDLSGENVSFSQNRSQASIVFSPTKQDAIRRMRPLAHTIATICHIKASAFQDFGALGNDDIELNVDFVTDLSPPQLESFTLDNDLGLLSLTFSELIDTQEFVRQLLSLRGLAGQSFTLEP